MSTEESDPAQGSDRSGGLMPLPVIEPEADWADEPRTVLLTGAASPLGRLLRSAWRDRYDLILIDHQDDPSEPNLVVADLAGWDEYWVELFDEADAVVHLAVHPDPLASWAELVGPNLDALANVFLASATSAIDRLVFASSDRVEGLDQLEPSASNLPADSPQVASKLWGERLGHCMARAYGLSFVALRLGRVKAVEGPSDPVLSDQDVVQIFTRAVEVALESGETLVVQAPPRTPGAPWPPGEAGERLGIVPEEAEEEPSS